MDPDIYVSRSTVNAMINAPRERIYVRVDGLTQQRNQFSDRYITPVQEMFTRKGMNLDVAS